MRGNGNGNGNGNLATLAMACNGNGNGSGNGDTVVLGVSEVWLLDNCGKRGHFRLGV
jgi:hypothetical protein